jgi:acyl-CoA synthetase (NDP forming)
MSDKKLDEVLKENEKLQKENKELKESDAQHKKTIKELMEKVKAQEEKEAVSKPEFTVKGQKYRLNVTALVINKERKEAKEILNDKKLQELLVEKESGAISKVK